MLRLHVSSVLLTTLAIFQARIMLFAAAAAIADPPAGYYRITRGKVAWIATEYNDTSVDVTARESGHVWSVTFNHQDGSYHFEDNHLKKASLSYVTPAKAEMVIDAEKGDPSSDKFRLERISKGPDNVDNNKYRIMPFDNTALSIQVAGGIDVRLVLRLSPDAQNNDQWTFIPSTSDV